MNKSRIAKSVLRTATAALGAVLSVGLILGATGGTGDPGAGTQVEAAGEWNATIDRSIATMRANGVPEATITVYINRLISAGVYTPPRAAATCTVAADGTKPLCVVNVEGRAWGGR